jgi:hypothetical protein
MAMNSLVNRFGSKRLSMEQRSHSHFDDFFGWQGGYKEPRLADYQRA